MKIESLNLSKALEKGWTEWKKFGKNRLYFDIKKSDLLKVSFYKKSGMVSFSELDGEKISHAEASRVIASKIFIDMDTMELVVSSDADEDMIDKIVKAEIAKIVDEPEEKEVIADETQENKIEKSVDVQKSIRYNKGIQEEKGIIKMKKVEFENVDSTEVKVLVDEENYGEIKFDADQQAWVLWPVSIDDAVGYFKDLKETEEAIADEIKDFD